MHAGVNDATMTLVSLQRVHGISCLVGGPAFGDEWAVALRRLDSGRVDVGLHLDFTEFPLLSISHRRLLPLIAASLLRQLDGRSIRAEIKAQLDRFESSLGRAPAFVDGHQHVHQLPIVRRELLDELMHRYRTALPWLRSTRVRPARASTGRRWWLGAKARGIEWLGCARLRSSALRSGFAQNHSLLGVYDFKGGAQTYRGLLRSWVGAAHDGDLLLCHPSSGWAPHDPIAAARLSEFEVLASHDFASGLHDAAVALAPMSAILVPCGHRSTQSDPTATDDDGTHSGRCAS